MNSQQKELNENQLIFEGYIEKRVNILMRSIYTGDGICFWSDRLVLIHNENYIQNYLFHNFIVFDLLTNEQRQIRFGRTIDWHPYFPQIHPLNNEVGIISEWWFSIEKDNFVVRYINFVKFNWDKNEFQLIERLHVDHLCFGVFVDKLNTSKFVLKWDNKTRRLSCDYQVCKLTNGKIEFGEIHQSRTKYDFYSNDKLIYMYSDEIKIYDLILKQEQTLKLDKSEMPRNFQFLFYTCELVNERLYTVIQLKNTKKYKIIWADFLERRWTLSNFETSLKIKNFHFFNENLIVSTNIGVKNKKIVAHKTVQTNRRPRFGSYFNTEEISERKIYSIPMRRPNSLRKSAWICAVQVMKNKKEKDPHKEVKEFLPLNSDLREVWFKDKEPNVISKAVVCSFTLKNYIPIKSFLENVQKFVELDFLKSTAKKIE